MTEPSGDARIARLVHDVRTPLTVIAGFAELLERGMPTLTNEQRSDYVARIAAAARELQEILDAEREERLGGEHA